MTNPKHPLYIVSKGRANNMITSRSLSRMKIPHNIVIEPQDFQSYDEALDKFDIRPYVTLLVAPFSNHGDGPGRARNWAWDHAISQGAEYHWVMDDNIADFYRLHKNQRIRVESGALFRACEDFTERYENVPMSGLQYRSFASTKLKLPPYALNTRIYSCNLIRNDCRHRWRGRYNEDTILSLDILKDGDCTIQFNFFLQGKCTTQTVNGGCTSEFYFSEIGIDEETGEAIKGNAKKEKDARYSKTGTIAKSQMLADVHPDVSKVVWKFGRWHHYVDYTPFKKNKLKLKKDAIVPDGINNYGLRLIDNFDEYQKSR